nr:thioesterase domain-containing protein [Flavimaribacter sediminis]
MDTPYVAPTQESEAIIVKIWSEVFEISDIGIDDDFFDLGGNSTIAETITLKVSEAFGITFKSGSLVEATTVRDVARVIKDTSELSLASHIVPLRSNGDRTPVFLVHGGAGLLFPSTEFMSGFHDNQPVYAFQVPGYDGQCEPFDTVEEIAAEYVRCMKQVSPDGPWHLAGFCNGSWIAFHMAAQLEKEGNSPLSLTLLDPGVQEGLMQQDYLRRRAITAKKGLKRLAFLIKAFGQDLTQSYSCYRSTKHWVNLRKKEAYEIPVVKEWIKNLNRERHKATIAKARQSGEDTSVLKEIEWTWDDENFDTEAELERRRTPEANEAIEKLKDAWYKFVPTDTIDMPVNVMSSESRATSYRQPSFPVRRAMPNLETTVVGRFHRDVISTAKPDNALYIQAAIDKANGGKASTAPA